MTLTRILLLNLLLIGGYMLMKTGLANAVPPNAWLPSVACTTGAPWCCLPWGGPGPHPRRLVKRIRHGRLEGDWTPADDLRRDGFLSVWAWNHVVAKDATALKVALQRTQVLEHTENDEAYAAFLADAELEGTAPEREQFKEQALEQIAWMNGPALTLAMASLCWFAPASSDWIGGVGSPQDLEHRLVVKL